ncbi:hypothetical protein [Clostridium haemolyticum]|uniref:Uncharacterized protein n=1 Tax=Clostridium haemolyticum NCTC 9693 TaxID=1443114 RepID=A0ABR4TFI3_CLOHA|nr:hypothetical protein [Clostridium haemolyticum]KEI16744.1 hypothetical protein Z960_08345 [Clostridium haemolyticum NCTC 9693]KGN04690.1 hypothetical protein Z961_01440 [Clostridium haemolyticum NCTC 8350]
MFSKGDKLVETKIDKIKTDLTISQKDYDREIEAVLEEISELVDNYSNQINTGVSGIRWQALSYKDQAIDHRIIAIKNNPSFSEEEKKEKINHFLPEGLFNFITDCVYEQQLKMLPKNVKPILVTVNNIKESPLKVTIIKDKLKDILNSISANLSEDNSIVGQYKGNLDSKTEYHHSSVITYYNKLKNGQGHSTRASVYDNFSINMKAMLWNNLEKHKLNLEEILSRAAIDICTDNLEDREIYNIVKNWKIETL